MHTYARARAHTHTHRHRRRRGQDGDAYLAIASGQRPKHMDVHQVARLQQYMAAAIPHSSSCCVCHPALVSENPAHGLNASSQWCVCVTNCVCARTRAFVGAHTDSCCAHQHSQSGIENADVSQDVREANQRRKASQIHARAKHAPHREQCLVVVCHACCTSCLICQERGCQSRCGCSAWLVNVMLDLSRERLS